jgi:BTB/POZ domain-containing protein 9
MTKRSSTELIEIVSKLSSNVLWVKSEDDLFQRVTEKEIMSSKEILLTEMHNKDVSDMFMRKEFCDSILRIEGIDIPVNRSVLASRCHHFRALFFGQMKESKQNQIELKDIKLEPFRHILHYIYSGKLFLNAISIELIIEILQLSQYYCFDELVEHIVYYLKISLSMDNIWVIQKAANLYSIPDLIRASNLFIDSNAHQIIDINNESFVRLVKTELIEMLERDSFYVEEEESILESVCFWIKSNCDSKNTKTIEHVLRSVRLKAINKKNFKQIIDDWGLDYQLFSDIYENQCKGQLKHEVKSRGLLVLNQNLASNRFDVIVTKGRRRYKMINDNNRWYTRASNCTCHSIGTAGQTEIMIELSKHFIINHMVLVLFDIGKYCYSYKIEVSVDRKNWKLIIDHTNYLCRSYQHLFFEPQIVKYIRIVGNKSLLINDGSIRLEFEILHFECMYCTIPVEIERNLVVPKVSVFQTIVNNDTTFQERKYLDIRSTYHKNITINGKVIKNDSIPFEKGSICWFSENCVNFQLSQPFLIDSIGFKLKSSENKLRINAFTYYVEISVDYENWKIVQDMKQIEKFDQKEIIKFDKQPILFIRIASKTPLLANNFELFECPVNNQILINSDVQKRRKS